MHVVGLVLEHAVGSCSAVLCVRFGKRRCCITGILYVWWDKQDSCSTKPHSMFDMCGTLLCLFGAAAKHCTNVTFQVYTHVCDWACGCAHPLQQVLHHRDGRARKTSQPHNMLVCIDGYIT
jgi:hypothetical protein